MLYLWVINNKSDFNIFSKISAYDEPSLKGFFFHTQWQKSEYDFLFFLNFLSTKAYLKYVFWVWENRTFNHFIKYFKKILLLIFVFFPNFFFLISTYKFNFNFFYPHSSINLIHLRIVFCSSYILTMGTILSLNGLSFSKYYMSMCYMSAFPSYHQVQMSLRPVCQRPDFL